MPTDIKTEQHAKMKTENYLGFGALIGLSSSTIFCASALACGVAFPPLGIAAIIGAGLLSGGLAGHILDDLTNDTTVNTDDESKSRYPQNAIIDETEPKNDLATSSLASQYPAITNQAGIGNRQRNNENRAVVPGEFVLRLIRNYLPDFFSPLFTLSPSPSYPTASLPTNSSIPLAIPPAPNKLITGPKSLSESKKISEDVENFFPITVLFLGKIFSGLKSIFKDPQSSETLSGPIVPNTTPQILPNSATTPEIASPQSPSSTALRSP